MNTKTLYLSSTNSSLYDVSEELELEDHTNFIIDLSKIYNKILPSFIKIDWGDGTDSEMYDNDMYILDRKEANAFSYIPAFSKTYSHEYYPSSTSLYLNLSAQVLINYVNGDFYWNIIPIKVRTYDYFESLLDVKLEKNLLLPTYPEKTKIFMKEAKNGYLLQLQED